MTRREALKRTALLVGTALSPSTLASALGERTRARSSDPINLTPAQFATVTAFTEHLLPRSTTPGALDAGVPQFIDFSCGGYLTSAEMARFTQGLAALDADCVTHAGAPFVKLSPPHRDVAMTRWGTTMPEAWRPFMKHLRELALVGYFTSELVGTTVLNYDPVPGRFDPCMPLDEVNHVAWTEG